MDFGLDYKPLASSNQDAQFVESKEVTVRDIARYFGVPCTNCRRGNRLTAANEQNAIEYVVVRPSQRYQYEEEQTWCCCCPAR